MNLPLDQRTILLCCLVLGAEFGSRALRRQTSLRERRAIRWAPLAVALPFVLGPRMFGGRLEPIPLVLAVLLVLLEPNRSAELTPPSRRSRFTTPLLLGLVSAALSFWVWSGADFAPRYHDESAYLLQAGIFAGGRWTDPSPPVPEFFEQFHVLVVPARAAKYPPGHALLLATGVLLGVPAAVPLVLVAGTGALLFVLTRRLAGERAAFLAWLVWTTAPGLFGWRNTYFSEVTTSFLWLAVWWAAWRWKESRQPPWLAAAGFGASWGVITRPLTMLLFFLPLAVALWPRMKGRKLRELAPAAMAGALPLLLLPMWSFRTTGSWLKSPLSEYTRAYLPFDKVGFGVDPTPPERALPQCMRGLPEVFLRIHRDHEPAALPRILGERVTAAMRDTFAGSRSLLFAFALLGVTRLSREGSVAGVTALLLFLGYLVYAHDSAWSLYYLETQSVLAAAAGIGLSAALRSLPESAGRLVLASLVAAVIAVFVLDVSDARAQATRPRARPALLRALLASVDKTGRAIVFVRCKPGADPNESLVHNGPDLENAPLWLAHDRGEQNARLQSLSRDRHAFLYDEARGVLSTLESPLAGAAGGAGRSSFGNSISRVPLRSSTTSPTR